MSRRQAKPRKPEAGVTLIELAITIALVGILAALIVNFVQPVRSYIDSSRRAALADTADGALRRMGRDLRLALPNSVRIETDGTTTYLEFLLVRAGGRYRYEANGAVTDCGGTAAEDALTFGAADTCFTSIGDVPNSTEVTTSDYVVVFNLPTGTDKADAYQSSCGAVCNKAQITTGPLVAGTGGHRINFTSNTFTFESPGRRFFIIEGAVTYACSPSGGTLTRHSGYGINATLATPPAAPPGGAGSLLASGVTGCTITYDTSSASHGLVTIALRLAMQDSRGDTENVNLYHAIHVNNVP